MIPSLILQNIINSLRVEVVDLKEEVKSLEAENKILEIELQEFKDAYKSLCELICEEDM